MLLPDQDYVGNRRPGRWPDTRPANVWREIWPDAASDIGKSRAGRWPDQA